MLKVINTYKWFYWHLHIFICFNKAVSFNASLISSFTVKCNRTESRFFSIKSCWCLMIWNKWEWMSKDSERLNNMLQWKLVVDLRSERGCTTRLLCIVKKVQEIRYTHRKQSCNTHFADDSANTSNCDTLRWKHCTGRTIGENKPSCFSSESRFLKPARRVSMRRTFFTSSQLQKPKGVIRNGHGFLLLLLQAKRGWRSFYGVAL